MSYPDLWEGPYKLERKLLTQLCHLMGSWDSLVRRGFQHFRRSETNERYVKLQNGSRVSQWHDHFYPSLFISVSLCSLNRLSETLSLLTCKQLRPLESDGRPEVDRRREAKGFLCFWWHLWEWLHWKAFLGSCSQQGPQYLVSENNVPLVFPTNGVRFYSCSQFPVLRSLWFTCLLGFLSSSWSLFGQVIKRCDLLLSILFFTPPRYWGLASISEKWIQLILKDKSKQTNKPYRYIIYIPYPFKI